LPRRNRYDFVFLTVKENQLYTALKELRGNISPTIVTMVNSLDSYERWEAICGEGRILPAFPGAGGGFDGEILDAAH
jgi:ketopantoate reductase (EC 1.1.1.169)